MAIEGPTFEFVAEIDSPGCGIGPELALLIPALIWLRRRGPTGCASSSRS